jgi:hypothetical protein
VSQPDVPKPTPVTDRNARVTATVIAARVHAGRGTSPYRLAADAQVIAEWLRTGVVVEDPALAELQQRFMKATNDGVGMNVVLPDYEMTYTPPEPPRRRWWRRDPTKRAAWRDMSRGHEQEHR